MQRRIEIKGLLVLAQVGVPDEELAVPQRLSIDLRFAACSQPENLHDSLSATINYAAVAMQVEKIACERPRRLIETLADDLAVKLQEQFQLGWIEVTVRKFILPNTDYVAVAVERGTLVGNC